MSFPWESIKADGQKLDFICYCIMFKRTMFRVLVGHMQKTLFNIMLIISKKGFFENNDKFCHFQQFFSCKYQNDDYICSSKFTGLFHRVLNH